MLENLNLQQAFFWISLVSTVLFVLKMVIFLLFGGDAEVDVDFDSYTDADPSFSFFSVQSILAFFMGLGWMGLLLIKQATINPLMMLLISFVSGVLFMFATAYLMFCIKKLNHNVKVDLNDYVGTEGKAYTSINPNTEGQIEIVINKKLVIMPAINITEEKIEAFAPIKIEKVENNKLYIGKI